MSTDITRKAAKGIADHPVVRPADPKIRYSQTIEGPKGYHKLTWGVYEANGTFPHRSYLGGHVDLAPDFDDKERAGAEAERKATAETALEAVKAALAARDKAEALKLHRAGVRIPLIAERLSVDESRVRYWVAA